MHVHGLGINPADEALFIAIHTGMYRVDEGERKAERVGGATRTRWASRSSGRTASSARRIPTSTRRARRTCPRCSAWADFHVLRFAGERVYGYEASNDRLLVSADRGRSWKELDKPGPLVDLAVDPTNARRIVATSAGGLEEGLLESRDGCESWRRVSEAVGLLAWPARLYLVAGGEGIREPGWRPAPRAPRRDRRPTGRARGRGPERALRRAARRHDQALERRWRELGGALDAVSGSGTQPTALLVDRLTKVYPDRTHALDALELRLPAGSFFGLLGPNGAGKATPIGSVAGLVRAPAGRIFVFGHDAVSDARARLLLGVTPQEVHVERFLTARELLVYHGRLSAKGGTEAAPAVGRDTPAPADRAGARAPAAAGDAGRADRRSRSRASA